MPKKNKDAAQNPYGKNVCKHDKCGHCIHITNVPDEDRDTPNVMGGCFLTGLVVFTDLDSCEGFEKWKLKD